MSEIKVDPQVLKDAAKKIEEYNQEIISAKDSIINGFDTLKSIWSGASAEYFYNNFNNFQGNFEGYSNRLKELSDVLNWKADEYMKADQQS